MPDQSNTLYENDFFAWANQQAQLLRDGRVDAADIEHIAEEIESMGRAEKRELVSRLSILLLHLLKWRHQPARRGTSWQLSVANTRDQLADHLADNPSLKAKLPEAIASAYRYARRDAARETGIAEAEFPITCPWDFTEITDSSFWP